MSIQETAPQTKIKNLAYAVVKSGNPLDPAALLIADREGRGQPKNVVVENKTIVWECEDGALEQIGFPQAPVDPLLLKCLYSKAGIMILNPGYEENDITSKITIRVEEQI